MPAKKAALILGFAVIAAILAYLLSPLFIRTELQEPSPLGTGTGSASAIGVTDAGDGSAATLIQDGLDAMTESEVISFLNEVVDMQREGLTEEQEPMPNAAKVTARGTFRERVHQVSGTALLIERGGQKTLRFEDFDTLNGPDLHVYLASGLSDEDYVDLGSLRATSGNVNYAVPAGTDTSKYTKVLIWCEPFSVLFGYAELGPA